MENPKNCNACGKPGSNFKCACKARYYCDRSCQVCAPTISILLNSEGRGKRVRVMGMGQSEDRAEGGREGEREREERRGEERRKRGHREQRARKWAEGRGQRAE